MLSALLACAIASTKPTPLRLPDAQGQLHVVAGDRERRATVAFLVIPDCPIARKFVPEMNRLALDYRQSNVAFYLVQVDPTTTPAQVREHAKEFGLRFPSLLDTAQKTVKLTGAKTVPTAAIFDPLGKPVYVGRIDDRFPALGVQKKKASRHDLRIALDQLLSGKPIRPSATPSVGCFIPRP